MKRKNTHSWYISRIRDMICLAPKKYISDESLHSPSPTQNISGELLMPPPSKKHIGNKSSQPPPPSKHISDEFLNLEDMWHDLSSHIPGIQNFVTDIYIHVPYPRDSRFHHQYTGWRRVIECQKRQVNFRKRATNYMALLQKMTYGDEASYDSTPACTEIMYLWSCTKEPYKRDYSAKETYNSYHTLRSFWAPDHDSPQELLRSSRGRFWILYMYSYIYIYIYIYTYLDVYVCIIGSAQANPPGELLSSWFWFSSGTPQELPRKILNPLCVFIYICICIYVFRYICVYHRESFGKSTWGASELLIMILLWSSSGATEEDHDPSICIHVYIYIYTYLDIDIDIYHRNPTGKSSWGASEEHPPQELPRRIMIPLCVFIYINIHIRI